MLSTFAFSATSDLNVLRDGPTKPRQATAGVSVLRVGLGAAIVADLQESGIAAPSTTVLHGQLAIRAAIVNHRTKVHDIDATLDAIARFGRARSSGRTEIHKHGEPDPGAAGFALMGTDRRSELGRTKLWVWREAGLDRAGPSPDKIDAAVRLLF